jgi:hypothetical protein
LSPNGPASMPLRLLRGHFGLIGQLKALANSLIFRG